MLVFRELGCFFRAFRMSRRLLLLIQAHHLGADKAGLIAVARLQRSLEAWIPLRTALSGLTSRWPLLWIWHEILAHWEHSSLVHAHCTIALGTHGL
jgi:hypothetical protein